MCNSDADHLIIASTKDVSLMRNLRIIFALVVLILMPVIVSSAILAPVHALQFNTLNVAIAGPGKVYWKSVYAGATYNSGWVNDSSAITLPQGAMITFIPEPLSGHHFTNWIINGYDQGSDSPFVLFGTGPNTSENLVANFDGTMIKNANGIYTNPSITSPISTPAILSPPVQYNTVQINVQGSGTINWSTSYGTSSESGSTNTGYTILVPYGATVTFTATPTSANGFNYWNVDSANLGSTNPYVMQSTTSTSTITGIFT
jgi:hypothetical protein